MASDDLMKKTYTVQNASQLTAILKIVRGGDTVLLTGGDYGNVSINKLAATSAITFKSADAGNPATFSSLKVANSSSLTFDHIKVDFEPTIKTVAFEGAVTISDSSKIIIANSVIEGGLAVNGIDKAELKLDATGNVLGLPAARAIQINRSSDITIADNDISTFHKGVFANVVDGLKVTGNEIHDLRTTPISGGAVSNVVIDGNHLYNSTPWRFGGDGDHGDFIHFWTAKGVQKVPSNNITIRNNFLDQGTKDPMLGIYLDDDRNGIGFTGVNIVNNVIANDNMQAIRLENTKGAVSNNTLIQPTASDYRNVPGVLLVDGSDVKVNSNLLGRIMLFDTSKAADINNLIITRLDTKSNGFYSKIFANALVEDPTLADLVLNPLAKLAGIGADLTRLPEFAWDVRGSTPPPPTPPSKAEPAQPSVVEKPAPTVLVGTDATDRLTDEKGHAELHGGLGDDRYVVGIANTKIVELGAQGNDTVMATVDYKLGANLENLTLLDGARIGTGNDLDNGIRGNDAGDTLYGMGGDDQVLGGAGRDVIYGGEGSDRLFGYDNDDILYGDAGDDVLFGGAGNDTLNGGAGDDQLTGGPGMDVMTGGAGADKFIFADGDFAGMERITDFSFAQKDKIVLNGMDAKVATAADDKFTFIGTAAFGGVAGQLRYTVTNSSVVISGDTNGDKVADFQIMLDGVTKLAASDFIL